MTDENLYGLSSVVVVLYVAANRWANVVLVLKAVYWCRYASAAIPARVQAFEHEMARAFASADLVIARAGASTCFELARAGKPAFLIPLPSALRNHQHFNAEAFAAAGAAAEGHQDELTPRALANYILDKIAHPAKLAAMAERMRLMDVADAAGQVADLVVRCAARR